MTKQDFYLDGFEPLQEETTGNQMNMYKSTTASSQTSSPRLVTSHTLSSARIPFARPVIRLTDRNVTIWGGSAGCVIDYAWDLVVALNGSTPKATTISMTNGAGALLGPHVSASAPVPSLTIDWPDGGAPTMRMAWWQALAKAFAGKLEGSQMPPGANVLFHCDGGIGRTGTALAIMAKAFESAGYGDLVGKDAVAWIRKQYHPDAIENHAQIGYLQALGVPVATSAIGSYSFPTEDAGRFPYEDEPPARKLSRKERKALLRARYTAGK